MNYKNYIKSTYQGHEDPREHKENTHSCDECGNLLQDFEACECINEYIEKYILPNESNENIKLYYQNLLEYDNEYIKEHQKNNTLY
tara:strand:- start:982 stop:1239 length:258 start_codon:yes stop_codon:yes gene_type:complete